MPGCKTLVDSISTNKPSTSMTHVACETKLHKVVTSSMHPCLGNCVATRHAVVYHARTAHAFSAGIKCRHCSPSISVGYISMEGQGGQKEHLLILINDFLILINDLSISINDFLILINIY